MGRRDILNGALLAVIGLGGAAAVAGITTPHTNYTSLLVWGGLLAVAVAAVGLILLFHTTPRAGLSLSAPERDFLPDEITPAVLVAKLEGRTRVQMDAITKTYAGKWLKFEGQLNDVHAVWGDRWMLFVTIPGHTESVSAIFGKGWHDRLVALQKGDWVTVEGKITSIINGPTLEPADLTHVGKQPKKPSRRPTPRKAS